MMWNLTLLSTLCSPLCREQGAIIRMHIDFSLSLQKYMEEMCALPLCDTRGLDFA